MIDELRKCFKCGYETVEVLRVCPKCGRRLLSVKQVRRLGWVQLILGLFLAGAMGAITFYLAPSLLHAGAPGGGEWFTGTAEQGLSTVGLFGLVIVFGLASMLSGLWQIRTGRRNKWILHLILALTAVLGAWLARVNGLLGG